MAAGTLKKKWIGIKKNIWKVFKAEIEMGGEKRCFLHNKWENKCEIEYMKQECIAKTKIAYNLILSWTIRHAEHG